MTSRRTATTMILSSAFVEEAHLATVMVTHNMKQAIALGNRLGMMHKGEIVLELSGEKNRRTEVSELVELFSRRGIVDDEFCSRPLPRPSLRSSS